MTETATAIATATATSKTQIGFGAVYMGQVPERSISPNPGFDFNPPVSRLFQSAIILAALAFG